MLEEWQTEGVPDFDSWNFQVKYFSLTGRREELSIPQFSSEEVTFPICYSLSDTDDF